MSRMAGMTLTSAIQPRILCTVAKKRGYYIRQCAVYLDSLFLPIYSPLWKLNLVWENSFCKNRNFFLCLEKCIAQPKKSAKNFEWKLVFCLKVHPAYFFVLYRGTLGRLLISLEWSRQHIPQALLMNLPASVKAPPSVLRRVRKQPAKSESE